MDEPNDIANLTTISYSMLLKNSASEQDKLLQVCMKWGFFYLDLSKGLEEQDYLETVGNVLSFSKRYFGQTFEVKAQDTRSDFSTFNICGYKPMALDTGNMTERKDGCEGLRIPSDLCYGVTDNKELFIPPGAKASWHTLTAFNQASYTIAVNILSALSDALELNGESRFEYWHNPKKSSTTTTVLQSYPHRSDLRPDISVGHFTHTDTGSITVLFNTEWGLQVHSPDTGGWEYVPPHPKHAIVNVGDTLKFMSGQKLKSSLHRVVPSHDKWISGNRYATIFFLRANDDAAFEDSEGQYWTAEKWLNRKFGGYRSSHTVQAKSAVSTGKTGFLGLWKEQNISTDDRRESGS